MPLSACPWQALQLDPELLQIPAMLSTEERQYLTWLTASRYQGGGAVVDLGPWLGGSTACLAEGLRRAGHRGPVHSFDLFSWSPAYMESAAPLGLRGGADFLPHFLRNVAPWQDLVMPHRADLTREPWRGGPIEILFVDAAKSWQLTAAILRGFGPALIPGRSRIVLQDFRYDGTWYLPLVFDRWPELWHEVETVVDGTTVVFQLDRPLPDADAITRDVRPQALAFPACEALLRARMTREPHHLPGWLAMLYQAAAAEGSEADLARIAAEYRQRLPDAPPPAVEAMLSWRAIHAGDPERAQRHALQAMARGDRSPDLLTALATASLRTRDTGTAESALDQLEDKPEADQRPVALLRADLYQQQGRAQEAFDLVAGALAGVVEHDGMLQHALWVLYLAATSSGQVARALELIETIGRQHRHPLLLRAHGEFAAAL